MGTLYDDHGNAIRVDGKIKGAFERRHLAMNDKLPRLNTIGRLAAKLNRPVHRIEYLIRSRGIEPAALAGNVRLFSEAVLPILRRELNTVEARRCSRKAVEESAREERQTLVDVTSAKKWAKNRPKPGRKPQD